MVVVCRGVVLGFFVASPQDAWDVSTPCSASHRVLAASRQDTRICSVAKGERSYHIFFQLLQVLLGVFFVEADNQPELP